MLDKRVRGKIAPRFCVFCARVRGRCAAATYGEAFSDLCRSHVDLEARSGVKELLQAFREYDSGVNSWDGKNPQPKV